MYMHIRTMIVDRCLLYSTAAHLPASVSQLAQRLQASISSGTTSPTTLPTTVQSADTSAFSAVQDTTASGIADCVMNYSCHMLSQ